MTAEIRPICGDKRVKLANVIPLETPFSMFVVPTTYCNFRCNYCGYSLGYKKMKEKYDFTPENMTLDTFKKTINQIKEFPNKLKMLGLTCQGEPLLNASLPEMVKIAKEAEIAERIEIISNGSLLTKEMSDGLIEAGLDVLRISLQGLNSQKYKEISNVNIDFNKFMDNIRYFYQNKKTTKLFVKVMDVSLKNDEENDFYNLFRECSDRMFVEKMMPAYDGVKLTENMDVDYDRYGRKHKERKVCPLPFFVLGVFPNGDVHPCNTIYRPITLGNVHNTSLIDIWKGDKLKKFQKTQLEGKRFENKKCSICYTPNDVSHPEDVLDDDVERILKFYR